LSFNFVAIKTTYILLQDSLMTLGTTPKARNDRRERLASSIDSAR